MNSSATITKKPKEKVNVQVAKCSCGKARKISATTGLFDRATTREFAKLMELGYKLETMTLKAARKMDLCFQSCVEKDKTVKTKK